MKRTHSCGGLSAADAGKTVVLSGWVQGRRDHGGLVFLDLRDREGITQVVLNPQSENTSDAKSLRDEYVVTIEGIVKKRPEGMSNKNISTGDIEIEGQNLTILSEAETLPFEPDDRNVNEMLRLKYRYLDLRSPRLQEKLKIRSRFNHVVRNFFETEEFTEVETPILWKSTPEGARDYLVPSRVSQGSFFALPQSPQTLKQLLMIAGFEKYYQITRCFRDEDLRADRQPEFTQLDMEMSFVDQEDIMSITERAMVKVWKEIKGVDLVTPFPRLTYDEAMNRYGCDKPDTRFDMELVDVGELVKGSGFKVFDDVVARGGSIKGFRCPKGAQFSRKDFDTFTDLAKQNGAKGLVWFKFEDSISSPVAKFFSPEKLQEIGKLMGVEKGDCAFVVADDFNTTCQALSALRLHLGAKLNLIDTSKDNLLWVTDFPLLEFDPMGKRFVARHHPFTAPKDEELQGLLDGDHDKLLSMKAKAYDLVCNGNEIAGGSVRIHQKKVQDAMFRALKISEEEAREKFGFFLDALKFGTPPHAGAAWGIDRIVMILTETDAIREVIAFPKTQKASCQMSETPSEVTRDQLAELGIKLAKPPQKDKSP